MHYKTAAFAVAGLVAQQAAATGWTDASSFSCPGNTNNHCSPSQSGGYNWSGLPAGQSVSSYGSNSFSGFSCSNSFGKRDLLTKREFQSKCISGSLDDEPSMSCDSGDSFSIDTMDISSSHDTTIDCHYGMPDGSTCVESHSCSAGGQVFQNTQCGGAKSVTFKPGKGSPSGCSIGVHSIGFHCGSASSSVPVSPSTSSAIPSVPVSTGPASSVPGCHGPGCSSAPAAPSSSAPAPGCYGGNCGSSAAPVPSCSGAGCSSAIPSVPVSTGPASSVPGCSGPGCGGSSAAPVPSSSAPAPGCYGGNCGSSAAPVPSCSGAGCGGSSAAPVPSGSSSAPAPGCYGGNCGGSSSIPAAGSSSGIPSYGGSSSSPVAAASSSSPAVSTPTPNCPELLPRCLNTWMFMSGCKGNSDSNCFCGNEAFIKNVMGCVSAWGSESEVSAAVSYLMGLCAPHVPSNPAIITGCPSTITPQATIPPASSPAGPGKTAPPAPCTTITYSSSVVVPATYSTGVSAGFTVPSSSITTNLVTTVTVPQVHLTTSTVVVAGQTSVSAGLGAGSPPAASAYPTGSQAAAGATGTGFGTSWKSTPTASSSPIVPATGAGVKTGFSFAGLALSFVGVLAAL